MARDPDRRFEIRNDSRQSNLMLYGIAAAAIVVLIALVFWPRSENRPGVATSDTSTRVERNAPSEKPRTDLSTPTPTKPAQ